MDVFRSLMTPGYLVRTSKYHGAVDAFDRRANMVRVQVGSSGPFYDVHISQLRAGNADTVEWILGHKAHGMAFPYQAWAPEVTGQARAVPRKLTEIG